MDEATLMGDLSPPKGRRAEILRSSGHPPKPRRISIVQSCYVPWKGFFDLIGQCDEYVIFDSVQYVKRHWHNRNRIKTANGVEWLTIPVVSKGRFEQPIDEVTIEKPWAEKHWRALELAYKRAPFFAQHAPEVKRWYEAADKKALLTEVNAIFLRGICNTLGLKTKITRDTAYPLQGVRPNVCLELSAPPAPITISAAPRRGLISTRRRSRQPE